MSPTGSANKVVRLPATGVFDGMVGELEKRMGIEIGNLHVLFAPRGFLCGYLVQQHCSPSKIPREIWSPSSVIPMFIVLDLCLSRMVLNSRSA